jgi:hypothetical protein
MLPGLPATVCFAVIPKGLFTQSLSLCDGLCSLLRGQFGGIYRGCEGDFGIINFIKFNIINICIILNYNVLNNVTITF